MIFHKIYYINEKKLKVSHTSTITLSMYFKKKKFSLYYFTKNMFVENLPEEKTQNVSRKYRICGKI